MAGSWSKERTAQHRARYKIEEAGERNRLAQARYRQRNAKRLADVRRVTNILLRQSERADDIKRLAAVLRATLTKQGIAALRRELRLVKGKVDDKLRWRRYGKGKNWLAPTGDGEEYWVHGTFETDKIVFYVSHGDEHALTVHRRQLGKAPTVDKAKALAQADYDHLGNSK